MDFYLTRQAVADRKGIAPHMALESLDKGFFALSEHPYQIPVHPKIRTGYYKHKTENHLIFYREIDTRLIEITRILHENRDSEARH
jgi:plasmid stabilization system protein ParE